MRKLRLPLPLAYADFQSLFCEFGTICLHNRNQGKDFVFDKNNELIIEQLFCYITNNSAFSGDLNKGIMLQGKYGCAKTILLETYSLLHNHFPPLPGCEAASSRGQSPRFARPMAAFRI